MNPYILIPIIVILFIIVPSYIHLCKSCNKSVRNIEQVNKEKEGEEETEYLISV
jgi:hypothetical protein